MNAAADLAAPAIEFDRVDKRYGPARTALAQLSLRVERGELALITGPSGAGKSTALRLMAALEPPSAGSVRVAGQDLARLRHSARAGLRRAMGIVPQDALLLDDRNVLANVMLPALVSGQSPRQARERAIAALERVGLPAAAHPVTPASLSGGEQRRVALARAMVNRPALLLADEPGAFLDAAAAGAVMDLLLQFAQAGVTVVVAMHEPPPAMLQRCRQWRLERGMLQDDAAARAA